MNGTPSGGSPLALKRKILQNKKAPEGAFRVVLFSRADSFSLQRKCILW